MTDGRAGAEFAIRATGLTRRAGGFLLDRVDVELPTGYVLGMVGANGAGKTTTIKALLGLVTCEAGSVGLLGSDVADRDANGSDTADRAARKERIGVVLDQPFLAPRWPVRRLGRIVGPFYSRWDQDRFDRLLRRFRVPTDGRVESLSRGQGTKLSLALALAHDPDLLILDEPTSGLDPVSRADIVDLVREFMVDERHSVLFSTHITSDLEGLADYVQILDEGTTAFRGGIDRLHEEFAYVRGVGEPDVRSASAIIGLRRSRNGFEGLIRTDDSALFGPETEITAATTDDVVVHVARSHRPTDTEEAL